MALYCAGVGGAVVAFGRRRWRRRRRRRVCGDGEGGFAGVEDAADGLAGGLDADGEGPAAVLMWLAEFAREEEAALRDGSAVGRDVGEGEERDAGLRDEARHDLVDGLVAVGGLGVPEVFGSGVGVEVRGEVVVDALAEGLFADVVLDHAEDCSGLAVGDAVEHLVDLAGGVRRWRGWCGWCLRSRS